MFCDSIHHRRVVNITYFDSFQILLCWVRDRKGEILLRKSAQRAAAIIFFSDEAQKIHWRCTYAKSLVRFGDSIFPALSLRMTRFGSICRTLNAKSFRRAAHFPRVYRGELIYLDTRLWKVLELLPVTLTRSRFTQLVSYFVAFDSRVAPQICFVHRY